MSGGTLSCRVVSSDDGSRRTDLLTQAASRTKCLVDGNLPVLQDQSGTAKLADTLLTLDTLLRKDPYRSHLTEMLRLVTCHGDTWILENDCLHAGLCRHPGHGLHCFFVAERVHGLHSLNSDTTKHLFHVHLCHDLTHHGMSRSGMWLVAGHGGRGIIQNDQGHIGLIIYGIDNSGDGRSKKCGISHKCKAGGIRLYPAEALRHIYACTHAKAGINHIERHGVSECVAADIPAEYGLLPLHGLLYGIEGGSVRTSRTEDRRPYRKLGNRGMVRSVRRRFRSRPGIRHPQKDPDPLLHTVSCIFTCNRSGMCMLAQDLHGKSVTTGQMDEPILDHGIQFLQTKDLVTVLKKPKGLELRKWIGRAHLKQLYLIWEIQFLQCFFRICITDPGGRDPQPEPRLFSEDPDGIAFIT